MIRDLNIVTKHIESIILLLLENPLVDMFLDIYNVLVEKTNFAYHISLFDS